MRNLQCAAAYCPARQRPAVPGSARQATAARGEAQFFGVTGESDQIARKLKQTARQHTTTLVSPLDPMLLAIFGMRPFAFLRWVKME